MLDGWLNKFGLCFPSAKEKEYSSYRQQTEAMLMSLTVWFNPKAVNCYWLETGQVLSSCPGGDGR